MSALTQMIVIAMIQEKGGVGKTTAATHLAAGLAVLGKKVLMIDADAQANATTAFGLEPSPGIYDLIVRRASWTNVLKVLPPEIITPEDKTCAGMLAVLPSNIETRNIATSIQDSFAIRKRLQEVKNLFDVVIVDTSPTPSLLHGSIFLATDGVFFPTQLELWSLKGLQNSIAHMEAFSIERQGLNLGPIKSFGIIPNMYRPSTVGHSENLRQLRDFYDDQVWPEMPQRIAWSDAASLQRPVWVVDPTSSAAREAWAFVERTKEMIDGN